MPHGVTESTMAIPQKVSAWGNSLGIRLPRMIAQQVGFTEGTSVFVSVEGEKIIVSPARPKYKLEDLLKEATPDRQHDELDWGDPVGEEW